LFQIPLHTLIKITPLAYGCHEERYPLPIAAVDTHRPKPSKTQIHTPQPGGIPPAPMASGAETGRDYFGDKSTVAAKALAIKSALESSVEKGEMTPSAAR
jgi:6-phosphofructo-2-kinase/fructose-2,6-biphosphatase 2